MVLRAALGALAMAALACHQRSPNELEAERQYAIARAARSKGDALTASAATETALVYEASTQPRDVLLSRLEVFARSPLVQTEHARATAWHQAQLLLRDETDARHRAICLTASGRANLQLGDIETATKELDSALRAVPSYIPALLLLAKEMEEERRWPEACKLYERVLEKDAHRAEALERYGTALVMMGELDRAIAFLDGARFIDRSPTVRLQLADALEARGRTGDAEAFLRQALARLSGEAQPDGRGKPALPVTDLAALRRRLAWTETDLGHLDAAEAHARQAQFDAPSVEGVVQLAGIALARGELPHAADLITRHLEELPTTPRCLWVAAVTMVKAGRQSEAQALAGQYVKRAANDPREGARLAALLALTKGSSLPK